MNDIEILNDLFGEKRLWKDKYKVSWCDLCETYTIRCKEDHCRGTSCNGAGCSKCLHDFDEFNNCKTSPLDYLNEYESQTYQKILHLKKYIKESLLDGDKEIDWQKMESAGKLCQNDHDIYFKEELKDTTRYSPNEQNRR